MMEKFRNLSNNIFFKIFLAFLGLTFVMFGVSGFILGNNNSWVAKIDGKTIQYDKFLQTLQDNKEAVARSNNSPEALKYLQSPQFKQDVLQRMITKSLTQSLREEFQIYSDKDLILQQIISNPNLKGSDGKFDRNLYTNLLKSNHLTEQQHIANISDEVVGSLIIQSFVVPESFNQNLAKDLYQYKSETRVVDLITVSTKNINNIKNPNPFELNAFFEKNESKFALPEMRRVSFVSFDINDLKQQIVISNDEIAKEYQDNKSQYQIPESRSVYHILLADKKEADEFAKSLTLQSTKTNQGQIFTKLSLAKGKDKSTIFLKNLTKKDLPKEIADDVFSLEKHQYSNALESQMGFHIFYIEDINPPTDIPLAKVQDKIKSKLIATLEERQAKDKFQSIEDEILATNSIDKVAEKFSLNLNKTLPEFSAQGLDSKNTKVNVENDLDDFIKNSFALKANKVSKILFSKSNNKYYIISVDEINQGRKRSLDEVKVLASDLLIKEQKKQKLQDLASNITKKINEDTTNIIAVVKENGLKISKGINFSRSYTINNGSKQAQYVDKLLNDIFATAINHATEPHQISEDEMVVAIVKNIQSPKNNEPELQATMNNIWADFQNDILFMFNQYVQKQFPVEINQKLIQTSNEVGNES